MTVDRQDCLADELSHKNDGRICPGCGNIVAALTGEAGTVLGLVDPDTGQEIGCPMIDFQVRTGTGSEEGSGSV